MENQRTRLSKRLLKEAVIELLQEKPLSKISIKSICDLAEVNRTTFYKYYQTERELIEEIENETIEYFKGLVTTVGDSLEAYLDYFRDNPKLAKAITNGNANFNFIERLFELPEIQQQIQRFAKKNIANTERRYAFILTGSYTLIRQWVEADFDISSKELSDLLYEMISKILQ